MTRRDIFGATAFTALASVAAMTIAHPEQLAGSADAGPQTVPDTELIALCARFDELERQCRSRYAAAADREEEKRAEAFCRPWEDEQADLFERIVATPAVTLAGFRAVAATWRGWDGQLNDRASSDGGWDGRLARKLVNYLAELPG